MSTFWKAIIIISIILNIALAILYLNALGQIRQDTDIMTELLLENPTE